LPEKPGAVLDYGCGDALDAERVAARCARLLLCDSAPSVRAALARRFRDNQRISVLGPDDVAELPEGKLDLVVANSVLQYLSREECKDFLVMIRPKLAPGGRLILADVVLPGGGIVADVSSLLSTAIRKAFLFAALAGLAQSFVSDYRRLRHDVGLTMYEENEMRALLESLGYTTERRARNFGFNRRRMTFIARPSN
ncbi:MAG: class I SAM-dependent methyltransferase, partial [Xanthobacteraceae bacterium]